MNDVDEVSCHHLLMLPLTLQVSRRNKLIRITVAYSCSLDDAKKVAKVEAVCEATAVVVAREA